MDTANNVQIDLTNLGTFGRINVYVLPEDPSGPIGQVRLSGPTPGSAFKLIVSSGDFPTVPSDPFAHIGATSWGGAGGVALS